MIGVCSHFMFLDNIQVRFFLTLQTVVLLLPPPNQEKFLAKHIWKYTASPYKKLLFREAVVPCDSFSPIAPGLWLTWRLEALRIESECIFLYHLFFISMYHHKYSVWHRHCDTPLWPDTEITMATKIFLFAYSCNSQMIKWFLFSGNQSGCWEGTRSHGMKLKRC